MPVTETVMALGDWNLRLSDNTPQSLLDNISTPFGQIVITPNRIIGSSPSDTIIIPNASYVGVVLRPGPQLELGGCGLAWFLGDDKGGAGVLESGITLAAATSLSSAVSSALSGSAFTAGSIGSGTLDAWSTGFTTRRDVLNTLARWFSFEWRINPDRTIDLKSPTSLYGATPTGVITRRDIGREAGVTKGITGAVSSTWDWEQYGTKTYVWSQVGYGTSGGASLTYKDPAGNALTIVRGYEYADAPVGSESTIAQWWLGQVSREVRTVSVSSSDYAVTGIVPCGGYIYLYDREQRLYDLANPIQFGGQIIWPVEARVVSITWPIERGMGVYYRRHTGSAARWYDLSDYVVWEGPGTQFEVSTGAQSLAPPSQAPPLSAFFSPWQDYEADWRGTSSNPSIGNGTLKVSFRRLGSRLEINGKIVAGSTSAYGAGEYRVILPPNCAARTGFGTQLGNLLLTDTGGVTIPASLWVDEGATEMRLIYWSTSTTATSVTPSAPFTWGTGAKAEFNGSFEIDP